MVDTAWVDWRIRSVLVQLVRRAAPKLTKSCSQLIMVTYSSRSHMLAQQQTVTSAANLCSIWQVLTVLIILKMNTSMSCANALWKIRVQATVRASLELKSLPRPCELRNYSTRRQTAIPLIATTCGHRETSAVSATTRMSGASPSTRLSTSRTGRMCRTRRPIIAFKSSSAIASWMRA